MIHLEQVFSYLSQFGERGATLFELATLIELRERKFIPALECQVLECLDMLLLQERIMEFEDRYGNVVYYYIDPWI